VERVYSISRCPRRRFFYDTEFMDFGHGMVDLISLGMVDESGRNELYVCNNEAHLGKATKWVWDNVIPKLPPRGSSQWMNAKDIRDKVTKFLDVGKKPKLELWGYFSAYDHVLLCGLYGRMVDVPKGFPWITMDLKQRMDDLDFAKKERSGDDVHTAIGDARWIRKAYLELEWRTRVGPV
jgi:hypothetical protein